MCNADQGKDGGKIVTKGPTRNLTVGTGPALAAVAITGPWPWDKLLTAPAPALGPVLSTDTPL